MMDGMSSVPFKVPYNQAAELSVLGSILFEGNMEAVTLDEPLKVEDFYLSEHQKIFSAMQKLDNDGTTIDLITLSNVLDGVVGIEHLKQLAEATVTSQAVKHYAKIVRQNSMRRKFIRYSQEITENASNPQVDFDSLQNKIEQMDWSEADSSKMVSGTVAVISAYQNIINAAERKGAFPGIPTGWEEFDKLTGGFCDSELIVIGARPSMGKTMFVINIIEYMVFKKNKDVAFFSLEMTKEEIMQRMMSSQNSVKYKNLRFGVFNSEEQQRMAEFINHPNLSKLHLCESVTGLSEIKAHCRSMKRSKQPPAAVVIDYLQIVPTAPTRFGSRNDELGIMSRELKLLAKELKCPVIVLSQLSRAPDKRPDKRPVLSDLRDSGAIEQDADLVVLLHREEYYDKDTSQKGMIEAIVAKARNGRLGTATLGFHPEMMQIRNIEWQIRDKDKGTAPASEPEKKENNGKQVSLE